MRQQYHGKAQRPAKTLVPRCTHCGGQYGSLAVSALVRLCTKCSTKWFEQQEGK